MKNTALITGASSGIGKEFSRLHAAQGGDLVVVARRQHALEELQRELEDQHQVSVLCIAADLTQPESPQCIVDQLEQKGIEIDVLINNAGFGGHGKFHQREWSADQEMIQLNVMALTELTRRIIPGMVKRHRGKILNVASTAAFLPGPLQAVYYATKAYVLSFSQAIAQELQDENISVTALCPGPVKTEFASVGDLHDVAAFQKPASPVDVARVGYQAMQKGKLVSINDSRLAFLLQWIVPLVPRRILLNASRRAMEKS